MLSAHHCGALAPVADEDLGFHDDDFRCCSSSSAQPSPSSSDPLVYVSFILEADWLLMTSTPLRGRSISLLLWAAGSGSAAALPSHAVNKQAITGPMSVYITVMPLSTCFLLLI